MSLTFDLNMSPDGRLEGFNKLQSAFRKRKAQVSESPTLKVLMIDPAPSFFGMSSLEPGPQQAPEDIIDFSEGRFCHDVPIIIGPSPDDRIQCLDQPCLVF